MKFDDQAMLDCPCCGAPTSIDLASIAVGEERPIVDCTVCCRPLRVDTQVDPDGEVQVSIDSVD